MEHAQTRSPAQEPRNLALRSPKRITITPPFGAYQKLQERCDQEGRSLSNLAAYLLEYALTAQS